jgi:hypothetical protein
MKKAYLQKLIIPVAVFLSAGNVNAQLVDCNIYLKGNHLEIGINNNGAFGSSYSPPSGYHTNTTDTMYNDCTTFSFNSIQGLGFTCDANADGWTTGTPNYYGDFVMANKPREGWGIADAAASATAYSYHYIFSSSGYTGPLSGGSTTYSSTGTLLQGVWDGLFVGTDTINVTQTTTTDVNNLFLLMHIDFYNTGITPDTIYYVRTINPQNESVSASNDTTKNIIEHQLPDPAGLVVVSATGLTDTNAYIAMGTNDARAKCFIIRDSTLPGFVPFATIYAGDTAHYKYEDTLTNDVGMGLIFKLILGPGSGTSIDFGYSFKGGILDSLLDTTTIPTLKLPKGANGSHIAAYPNPANDVLNITGAAAGNSLTLYDITGKVVAQTQVINPALQTMPLGNLIPGMYILAVKDAGGALITRIPVRKM